MAKFETNLKGNFDQIIRAVDNAVHSSLSASTEESSDYVVGDARIVIKAYERYSVIGENRVSLTVTFVQCQDSIRVTAVATGGSQAMFFKMNTFGEKSFLNVVTNVLLQFT
ncbi:MAG: DUF6054 family protein [Lachnospiraceae bacterium]|nr:DUF6054 family protein [Lachnospiraceae bacterium]